MNQIKRKIVLDVPYKEKEEAKELGARWDNDLKKWFVPAGEDPEPFAKWFQGKKPNVDGAVAN